VCGAILFTAAPTSAQEAAEESLDAELSESTELSEEQSTEDENLLPATPTADGGTGLFRVTSAQTGEEMTFRLSMSGQFFSGQDIVRTNDETSRFVGTLGISATPLSWMEPYLILMARSSSNTFNNPEAVLAQGDTALGAKVVYPVAEGIHVGGDLRLIFMTGAGQTSFDFGATSARFSLLGTFDATDLAEPLPLRAHVNLGFFADNSDQLLPEDESGRKLVPSRVDRFSQGVSAFSQITFGLGFEVPLAYFTPSIEYSLGVLSGDEPAELCEAQPLACPGEAGFGGNPQNLTIGVKGMPLPGLIASLGVDIGLTSEDVQGVPVNAPYNVMLGLTYAFDPRSREVLVEKEVVVEKEKIVEVRPPAGVFNGKVVDADTGKPVKGVLIEYRNQEGLSRQATDPKTGEWRSYDLTPGGEVEMRVSAPEYKTKKMKRTPEEGDNELVVRLKPVGKMGFVKASVVNDQGDAVTGGSLVLTGPKTYTIKLDGKPVKQKVLVGEYTAAITTAGFLTAGRDIKVESKQTIDVSLNLRPRPAEAIVSVGETRILMDGLLKFDDENTISESSEAKLEEVVAALLEHPEFSRVRVESHWDDSMRKEEDRVAVTQSRAKAVMDFLVKRGISVKRLESKGFGSEQPLVPNSGPRNRALNKRVEFAIVSKKQR
jgi:outer membrane protein OmpA-like peptidoglycan-associated protein